MCKPGFEPHLLSGQVFLPLKLLGHPSQPSHEFLSLSFLLRFSDWKHFCIHYLLLACQYLEVICQRKMEWKILQVSRKDRISNERRKTGMIDAASRAQQLKWRWGGHVARMHHLLWMQQTTMWDPRIGQRTAGRPKMRWADDFKKTAGTRWSTQARSRATWRALEREATQVL